MSLEVIESKTLLLDGTKTTIAGGIIEFNGIYNKRTIQELLPFISNKTNVDDSLAIENQRIKDQVVAFYNKILEQNALIDQQDETITIQKSKIKELETKLLYMHSELVTHNIKDIPSNNMIKAEPLSDFDKAMAFAIGGEVTITPSEVVEDTTLRALTAEYNVPNIQVGDTVENDVEEQTIVVNGVPFKYSNKSFQSEFIPPKAPPMYQSAIGDFENLR